MHRKYVV